MSFFDPPAPEPEPEPELWPRFQQRAWQGPPENALGMPATVRVVLYRSSDLVIALFDFIAYPTGLLFDIHAIAQNPDALRGIDPMVDGPPRRLGQPFTVSDRRPRFGAQFSDGRKATSPDDRWRLHPNDPPGGPVLQFHQGGGGDTSTRYTYWLWPLPPPGDLDFVLDWPSRGIPETRETISADPFITAAAQTITLWEDSTER
jgi:hypothetical protein